MILTITLNPSVDISYPLEDFNLNTVNRVALPKKTAGGKGLNVTRVLHEAGQEVVATGLIGGQLGDYLSHQLTESGIANQFLTIKGETRNCIAILHQGMQTEILENGPYVDIDEADAFTNHLNLIIKQFDVVTISGSLPRGLEQNYYSKLIATAKAYDKKVVLDCSGQALIEVLKGKAKPTVIKPNKEELEQILGSNIKEGDLDHLKELLKSPIFEGIEWIIVSLGANGAFAKHLDTFYKVTIPKITVANPVGSGDSTVAGIAWALQVADQPETLLKKANVLGMLNAQEAMTGHVNMANYNNLFEQLRVEEV